MLSISLEFIFNLAIVLVSVIGLAMAIKLAKKDKNEYAANHIVSKDFSKVVRGTLKPVGKAGLNGSLSKGVVYDKRTGELTPCAQLSRESLL